MRHEKLQPPVLKRRRSYTCGVLDVINHEPPPADRVEVGGVLLDAMTEADVLAKVERGWRRGQGGLIVTPNVDIWRLTRSDPEAAALVRQASIVVADGQPLVWASRLAGTALPERVTGSGLVESLAGLCAASRRCIYVIGGGEPDTAQLALDALQQRYPGLRVAGGVVPPFGFERDPAGYQRLKQDVVMSGADLVLVGLGFPKQERLAAVLAESMPSTWFLCCGGGVAMAGGVNRRPHRLVQQLGLEWVARLVQEPRRLSRRYLVDDAPAAVRLLAMCLVHRFRHRGRRPV
jgi:N-acetylglucosaminyldiphosphoundecaprenol N-acetyl-beta-D-mannosaminyltransferase